MENSGPFGVMEKKFAAAHRRDKFRRPPRYFPKRPVLEFKKESHFSMNAFPLEMVDGACIWN